MIQRLQSVYLLIATVLGILCLCNPIGHLTMSGATGILTNIKATLSTGETSTGSWALFAILLFATILNGSSIFMYRNRMLQMRTLVVAMLFLIGYYGFMAFFVFIANKEMLFRPTLACSFPLITLMLDYMAFCRIQKDEMLIRSLDRLR